MSYIPNCRPKLEKDAGPFPHKSEKDVPENAINPYWYGLLRDKDETFLQGFDYNTRVGVDNLFDNLDVFRDDLEAIGIDVDDIDENIVNGADDANNITMPDTADDRECKWYDDYTEEELSKMSHSTRVMLFMKYMLSYYIEMQRDELVTSMIDGMDEAKYKLAMTNAAYKQAGDVASDVFPKRD